MTKCICPNICIKDFSFSFFYFSLYLVSSLVWWDISYISYIKTFTSVIQPVSVTRYTGRETGLFCTSGRRLEREGWLKICCSIQTCFNLDFAKKVSLSLIGSYVKMMKKQYTNLFQLSQPQLNQNKSKMHYSRERKLFSVKYLQVWNNEKQKMSNK